MITVAKIHVSPVKSLALSHPAAVDVGWQGIDGDRRLFLVDERGRLLTQRQVGRLAGSRPNTARNRNGWPCICPAPG